MKLAKATENTNRWIERSFASSLGHLGVHGEVIMRQLVIALLVLIAAPTIAWGDAYDDEKAKLECWKIMDRGKKCLEWFWMEEARDFQETTVERGAECAPMVEAKNAPREPGWMDVLNWAYEECKCNRHAYQDFDEAELNKFRFCNARY